MTSSDIEPPRLPSYRPPMPNDQLGHILPHRDRGISPREALNRAQVWQIVSCDEYIATLEKAKYKDTTEFVSKHPKCSLNLVCFRGGKTSCEFYQIQTVLESRFESKNEFQKTIASLPSLIYSDPELFSALRDVYQNKMCGFWRKTLSLKTLRGIRILSVSSHAVYSQIRTASLK